MDNRPHLDTIRTYYIGCSKDSLVIPSVAQATAEDIQAITETSRDYIGGRFTTDEEQVRRSMHPQLVKHIILENRT